MSAYALVALTQTRCGLFVDFLFVRGVAGWLKGFLPRQPGYQRLSESKPIVSWREETIVSRLVDPRGDSVRMSQNSEFRSL